MKKILTLLLLFTITLFLSGNQVVITQNYNFIVSNQSTFNFSTGALTSDNRYQRTNKIAITNDKVLADTLKYHYAFFWDEADTYLGYYKTNRGVATSGTYLGQVNTQNIPLPLNAYSFALVRYDNNYVLVNGYTIKDLFIDNNLDYDNLPDFNDIPIPELNGLTLNQVFQADEYDNTNDFANVGTATMINNEIRINTLNPIGLADNINIPNNNVVYWYARFRNDNVANIGLRFRASGSVIHSLNLNTLSLNGRFQSVLITTTAIIDQLEVVRNTGTDNNLFFSSLGYVNLTNLGLTSLTLAQLNRYFELYTNPINWIYYKTDGNVSSRDNHYYAAGKNLFDESILEVGGIFNATGLNETRTDRTRSGFINVVPNTQYTMTNFGTVMFFYDINQNFISLTVSTTFTTTNNTYFVRGRFSGDAAFVSSEQLNPTLQLEQAAAPTTFERYAAPTDLLNLTLLFGLGNEPDLATMNTYYAAYEEYLEYDFILPLTFENQTLSYEEFYFDDGVSTEIEQLGSILIFTLIGFTLMIFGFTSNRRIFNLLSIGAFVVLGVLLVEFVGFLIILFGLIFLNVYYTFFGEL